MVGAEGTATTASPASNDHLGKPSRDARMERYYQGRFDHGSRTAISSRSPSCGLSAGGSGVRVLSRQWDAGFAAGGSDRRGTGGGQRDAHLAGLALVGGPTWQSALFGPGAGGHAASVGDGAIPTHSRTFRRVTHAKGHRLPCSSLGSRVVWIDAPASTPLAARTRAVSYRTSSRRSLAGLHRWVVSHCATIAGRHARMGSVGAVDGSPTAITPRQHPRDRQRRPLFGKPRTFPYACRHD